MSKQRVILFSTVILLGGLYIYYFTDFFTKPVIFISARPRIEQRSRTSSTTTPKTAPKVSMSFVFSSKAKITDLKVVPVQELETNKYPHAVWHLISDTASEATKGIVYGDTVRGMKPKIPKTKAEPLEPQTKYRLFVEAGESRGQVDFEIPGIKSPQ